MNLPPNLAQRLERLKSGKAIAGFATLIIALVWFADCAKGRKPASPASGAGAPGAVAQEAWKSEIAAGRDAATAGKLEDAERLFRSALAKAEAAPQNDPSVAASAFALGDVLLARSMEEQAQPILQRALDLWERALGPDDARCAEAQNKLGLCWFRLGQLDRAEPLYRSALASFERAAGKESPSVATALNNLAGLAKTRGDYAQAESLYARSISIKERALSRDHPDLARGLYNLARLYHAEEKYGDAERCYRRALQSWQRSGGDAYEYANLARRNYAALLRKQNRDADADSIESGAQITDANAEPAARQP